MIKSVNLRPLIITTLAVIFAIGSVIFAVLSVQNTLTLQKTVALYQKMYFKEAKENRRLEMVVKLGFKEHGETILDLKRRLEVLENGNCVFKR